ncbi:MAG: beta-ketoacyl-[acyl-carrier-protein] synthase family protein [Sorangiineae bacterium]|nr:beta-ketoacyl-[acyl-carrier-protein] synthase family protein [Polyangiaceae bacterium]MEB2320919.1 beta-ketoacyl-[acyl-carrier-protein] synthase family protein [Sorangiineae bacterium]
MPRVAITGLGLLSPLGLDVESSWEGLSSGRSGVDFITEFPTDNLRTDIAASVRGFDGTTVLEPRELSHTGRITVLGYAATLEAARQAKLEEVDKTRVGVLVSSGQGSVEIFEDQLQRIPTRGPRSVSPYFIPTAMPNALSGMVTTKLGLMGPSFNIVSACATSAHSLAIGATLIASGDADVVLAGGGEAATRPSTIAGFGNARALTRAFEGDPRRASRPYDKQRNGFVIGEGAGTLVLESEEHARRRGARPLAWLSGWGMSSDAEHMTRPHPEGLGLALAMNAALRRAGITPAEVGYLNPHATSTPAGDVAEYRAFQAVFGDRLPRIPISATKSMIGHLLGGAGAAESIACVCTLRDQRLHPSINVDELDPVFDLDVVREPRAADVRYALKTSAGFGGHNCALLFERAD